VFAFGVLYAFVGLASLALSDGPLF